MSADKHVDLLETVKRAMSPESQEFEIIENGVSSRRTVERRGLGPLTIPSSRSVRQRSVSIGHAGTKYSLVAKAETESQAICVWQYDFRINDSWDKYSVIVKAEIDHRTLRPVFADPDHLTLRIDSGCETGQVFHDLTCECSDQLHQAIDTIVERGEGMVICIPRQDGRGMGLPFKLGTLWLQHELGVDTVESARLLSEGGEIDTRTYGGVIAILKFFGISNECAINLASNNPRKAGIFQENGYAISEHVPVVIKPTVHTARHLAAKQKHLGHRHLVSES